MKPLEPVLWSIAFPGFGQIRNGRFLKGVLFIGMEFVVNSHANLNQAIVLSFTGRISEAIQATNYQWIMFYPCIYLFSIWDAFGDASAKDSGYAVLPAAFAAYFGTLGVIFSGGPVLGLLLGPVWSGLAGMLTGAVVGWSIKTAISPRKRSCDSVADNHKCR